MWCILFYSVTYYLCNQILMYFCRLTKSKPILHLNDLYGKTMVEAAKVLLKSGTVQKKEEKSGASNFVITQANTNVYIEIHQLNKRNQSIDCSACGKGLKAPCVHAVATLLWEEKKNKKTKQKSETNTLKLTVQAILDQTPKSELNAFLASYAKRDKKFQMALKVNFAYRLEVKDNAAKFKTILNDIIPIKTSVESKIGATQLRYFLEIGETFLHQLEDLFALENYREAFSLFASLFNKLEYVLFQNIDNAALRSLSKQLHTLAYSFFIPNIGRNLQDEAVQFFIEIAAKSYYNVIDIHDNIFVLLYGLRHHALADKIKIILKDNLNEVKTDQMRAIYLALIMFKSDEVDNAVLMVSRDYPLSVLPTHDHLIELGKTNLGIKLLEAVYGEDTQNFQVIHRLLYGFITEKKFTKVRSLAVKSYILSNNIMYLDLVRDNFSDVQYEKVLIDIKQHYIKLRDTKKLFNFFIQADLWQDAFVHLFLHGDIYDVQEYDLWLQSRDAARLEELYLKKLYEATIDQSESQVNDTVKQITKHLSKRRFFSLEKKVKAFLDSTR